MNYATVLAEVLGIICLVCGLNAFLNRKAMAEALQDVGRSPALLWIWGFINLLLGAAVIALYSVWTLGWTVLISILGWGALVKGVWLILFPDSAKAAYLGSNKPGTLAFGGIVAIVVGVILLWVVK